MSVLLMWGLLLLGCSCPPSSSPRAPSLLLITVDTLRSDRLGCYGMTGAETPVIDRLGHEGARFVTAITPLPRTTPSIASLMTGLAPTRHCVRGLKSSFPSDVPTLAEWMRARGRRTGAFTSNVWLRPAMGFGRGFEAYSNPRSRWAGDSAREVTDEALEWSSKLGGEEPFFLWVHYLDPHWTYDPPPPFDTRFDPGFTAAWPYASILPGEAGQGAIIFRNTMSPAEVRHAVALYQGEIAATDIQVGRLIEGLKSAGRLNDTLIVLTSDHGESLGEHDYFFDHGEYLYEGTLLVPLILQWTGHVPAATVVTRMARLMDVAPTVMALLGDPLPSGIDGRSLADDLSGTSSPGERECWIESDHSYVRPENPRHFVEGLAGKWRGLRGERYKLIFVPRDASGLHGDVELYDIHDDPQERHDLSGEKPDLARSLLARLESYWAKNGSACSEIDEPPPDIEILKQLGYAATP